MAKTAGQFKIEINNVVVTFTKRGETYKSVETPSGIKPRKVVEWVATYEDEEVGTVEKTVYALPRTNRAGVVEQYENRSQGIIY